MIPYLDSRNNPHLRFEILLAVWTKCDCIIDTGFSGGIALPERYRAALHKEPALFQEFELADGSYATYALYTTKIKIATVVKEQTFSSLIAAKD